MIIISTVTLVCGQGYTIVHINYIDLFNSNIFIKTSLIFTYSHLDVISGGLWQLLVEPWMIFQGTTCVQRPTISSIPQRIITIKMATLILALTGCITFPTNDGGVEALLA